MTRSKKPATRRKKDSEPQWRTVRVRVLEEDLELLEKDTRSSCVMSRAHDAGILLANALHASWAYSFVRCDDRDPASDRDYFLGIWRLQEEALKAANTAKSATAEVARRYQQWLDAEKARRDTKAARPNVVGGKFGSASKGAAS